jgi:uncharacterized protein YjbJ (UPF0337 family)
MFERTEGAMQNIAGRVQDAFGAATGDTGTQVKGKIRRVAGEAQYGLGDVLDQVREAALKNPIGTVAVTAGVFFVIGAIWSKR